MLQLVATLNINHLVFKTMKDVHQISSKSYYDQISMFFIPLNDPKPCHSVYDDLKTDIPTKPENIFVCVTKIQNIVAHLFSSKWINLVMDQLLQLLNSLIVHINLSNERWHGASSVSRPSYNTGPIIIIIVMNLFVFQEWTTKWYTHVSKRRTLLLDRDKKKGSVSWVVKNRGLDKKIKYMRCEQL